MDLDPAVRKFLDTKPDSGDADQPIASRRELIRQGSDFLFDAFGQEVEPVPLERDFTLRRPGAEIRVRVYRPGAGHDLPIHVFLHGGGFWLGSIDERVNEAICRDRSRRAGCVVVAVDYRLSPEHRFPIPVDDCSAGLLWAYENASEIGGDPANISIGGVSAGATLAAAATLAARDRQVPALRLQLLEVPALDLTLQGMRNSGVGDEYGITVSEMELCRDLYLPSAESARDPLASPLHAGDLTGFPPTRIMTAQFDPLRHDGERFAARLGQAGVDVSHRRYPGAVHGSLALTRTWPPAQQWHDDVVAALREAHAR
ncbi:alpha/beta hydrolase [Actinoplanes sp. NPDC051513]|uniref:alpha/beta hydrolase n=1 Tax=Actinoplanes sp. NPDC051513 TaxID=3363908 RepID=UPI0037A7FFB8